VIEFTANAKDHELLTTGLSNILPPSITLEAGIKTQDRIQFRLRSNGIAAHASEPPLDGGANALLVRLIANIERSIMLKKSVATSFRVERLAAIAEQAASTSPSFAIDFRLHPKDSRATVMKQIEKLVGGEMEFKITEDAVIAPQSSTNNALFRALSAAHKHFERSSPIKSKIETPILTSTTDAAFFRQKGMTVYGFEPLPIDPDDDNSHGDNERILVSSVRFATDVMEFTLKNL
jgi:acetylornithine deacetylase/succinyl-diaminopimelate desuccinylase-like protein